MGNRVIPREKFSLWMTLNRKLSTKDRLMKFEMMIENKCAFCEEVESIDPLLFACNKYNQIWRDILMWMSIQTTPKNWTREKVWLIQRSKRHHMKS